MSAEKTPTTQDQYCGRDRVVDPSLRQDLPDDMVGDEAITPSCVGFTSSYAMSLGAPATSRRPYCPPAQLPPIPQSPAFIWLTVQHKGRRQIFLRKDLVLGIHAVGRRTRLWLNLQQVLDDRGQLEGLIAPSSLTYAEGNRSRYSCGPTPRCRRPRSRRAPCRSDQPRVRLQLRRYPRCPRSR